MLPAISLIKLFLLIILALIFLMGLGWLAVGPLIHGNLTNRKKDILSLQEIPLALICGMIIDYGVLLVLQSLISSLIVGGFLSMIGMTCFITSFSRIDTRPAFSWKSMYRLAGVCTLGLFLLGPILAEPLSAWDARSIWFFHAKMIYTAGSIGQAAGWQDPSIVFSHADYPNLVPSLAAQAAQVMGFWNEYLPKIALFFMLVPAAILLSSFSSRSFSFIILIFLFPFYYSFQIWFGYMDGYLALYFSMAMLLLGRYLIKKRTIDLVTCISCLFLLLYIKNEGILAALAGLIPLVLMVIPKKKVLSVKCVLHLNWKFYLAILVGLFPLVLWNLYKQQWHLTNDLGLWSAHSFQTIVGRITDGSIMVIIKSIFSQIKFSLLLLGILTLACIAWKIPNINECTPALMAASIYLLGMLIIYLQTTQDLAWILRNSVDRTMLSCNSCIYVACFYLMYKIENKVFSH